MLEKKVLRKSETKLSIHGHNMRSKLNFHVEFCNTVLYQESLDNMGIKPGANLGLGRLGSCLGW